MDFSYFTNLLQDSIGLFISITVIVIIAKIIRVFLGDFILEIFQRQISKIFLEGKEATSEGFETATIQISEVKDKETKNDRKDVLASKFQKPAIELFSIIILFIFLVLPCTFALSLTITDAQNKIDFPLVRETQQLLEQSTITDNDSEDVLIPNNIDSPSVDEAPGLLEKFAIIKSDLGDIFFIYPSAIFLALSGIFYWIIRNKFNNKQGLIPVTLTYYFYFYCLGFFWLTHSFSIYDLKLDVIKEVCQAYADNIRELKIKALSKPVLDAKTNLASIMSIAQYLFIFIFDDWLIIDGYREKTDGRIPWLNKLKLTVVNSIIFLVIFYAILDSSTTISWGLIPLRDLLPEPSSLLLEKFDFLFAYVNYSAYPELLTMLIGLMAIVLFWVLL